MKTTNIYETIYNMKYDYNIEKNGYVILRKHQIIPKYYLMTNDINVIILNYSTGSGKTLSGVFAILNKLYLAKVNQLLNKYEFNKAVIVGEWLTENQFRNEISRPIFDFPDKIDKYVDFYGYQSLFISLFPYYYEKNIQDLSTLISDLERNELKVKQEFVNKLRNTIIIVDEIQNLYSKNGLNTYGFTISYLSRISKDINLKIILMTGTLFNSSISEISSLLNIISPMKSLYSVNDFCTKDVILDNVEIQRLRKDKINDIIDIMKNKYIYFSSNIEEKKYTHINKPDKNIYIYGDDVKSILLYKSKNENFPDEYKIGNILINDTMNIYQLPVQGEQLKAFESSNSLLEDETDNLNIYDAYIPTKSNIKNVNGVYEGEFLKASKLINYSRIGYEIINLCLNNAFHNEKTVIYHNKINNFGLLQYGKILEYNGLVEYGNDVKRYSICRLCKNTLEKHTKKCVGFTPIYFHYLTGKQKEKERKFVVNNLYNSPNNLYGEIIDVLLISDVAYSGVSLLNTNNLAIISRVPNISKMEQILSRIRRMKSHYGLPKDKRYVKYYIYGICSPKVKKNNTEIYKYYKTRAESDSIINNFLNKLIPKSIGNVLLNKPREYKLSKRESDETSKLFFEDGKYAIEKAIYYLYKNSDINGWRLDMLIKRIKDSQSAISYVDLSIFPDEYIKIILFNSTNLKIFEYKPLKNIVFVKQIKNVEKNTLPTNEIKFNDIYADYNKVISKYKKDLVRETSNIKKRVYYNRLMDVLNMLNDFTYLVDFDYIWKFTFIIHNEYYDTDETDFYKNHSSMNRNENKMSGLYWQNKIVMMNGKYKFINYSFKEPSLYKNTLFSFKCVSVNGLHTVVYNYSKTPNETDDNRFKIRGNDCWSFRDKEFSELFKHIKNTKNTPEFCDKLLAYLCEEQLKSDNIFITSPFFR